MCKLRRNLRALEARSPTIHLNIKQIFARKLSRKLKRPSDRDERFARSANKNSARAFSDTRNTLLPCVVKVNMWTPERWSAREPRNRKSTIDIPHVYVHRQKWLQYFPKKDPNVSYKLSRERAGSFRAIGSPTLIARDPFTGDFSDGGSLLVT